VRFSTVAGSRGSTDLARDVRGFAVKFYTDEGNFDLVGNNIPVFFIQDAVKFPDLVHAVKPEPHNEIPQAASAHDTFWDFISLMPESMHMIMWVMSDRAIPRSLRMMEGFGIHTFRLVDARGAARFVKFHWKPKLGVHSVLWDEALKISGKDPDFHRRDLWEAIAAGAYPEWELGLQVIDEADEHKFAFDLLDPTKLVPEEQVPVERVGRLVLDRNPENFFAETEQVAFHPGHVVPGIEFSDDPLLQGRLFSYTDTQLTRLGGPNFHEIPINRPIAPMHNNQRDGHMRQNINVGRVAYHPNTLGGGCPMQAGRADGGFVTYPERLGGPKVRERGEKFFDHFSQAALFWNSQSDPEKQHIVEALRFELGKVEVPEVRERVVGMLAHVDRTLAGQVAEGLGLAVPKPTGPMNRSVPADADPGKFQPIALKQAVDRSEALSMAKTVKDSAATRKVAILAADGVDGEAVAAMQRALLAAGAVPKIVAPRGGSLKPEGGGTLPVDFSLLTVGSVLFDAVFVPGGSRSTSGLAGDAAAVLFVREAYKHCKAIAASGTGVALVEAAGVDTKDVLTRRDADGQLAAAFVKAIARHRDWSREAKARTVPA
jgi:catalase